MFAILLGTGAAALFNNTQTHRRYQLRTPTQEERATMEYGINTLLDQNNDYLYTGQKHLLRRDNFLQPYASYGDAVDQYNKRFENKSRLVNHIMKIRNPSFTVPNDHDHMVRMNLITPFVMDPAYHASAPKPHRVQHSGGWWV